MTWADAIAWVERWNGNLRSESYRKWLVVRGKNELAHFAMGFKLLRASTRMTLVRVPVDEACEKNIMNLSSELVHVNGFNSRIAITVSPSQEFRNWIAQRTERGELNIWVTKKKILYIGFKSPDDAFSFKITWL